MAAAAGGGAGAARLVPLFARGVWPPPRRLPVMLGRVRCARAGGCLPAAPRPRAARQLSLATPASASWAAGWASASASASAAGAPATRRWTGSGPDARARMPDFVRIVEVGPRDGLQNESRRVAAADKVAFIDALSGTGLAAIEATAFVSAKWVPQMGDAREVLAGIRRAPGVAYAALTPNVAGLEAALAARADEVAIFAAASDAFSLRNINCTVLESLARFKPLVALAQAHGVRVRGYVSCALGCPYAGRVEPEAVGFVAQSLLELGVYEVSLGDTIGVGTPRSTRAMLEAVRRHIPLRHVAVHLHNTYGCALPNILVALEMGVTAMDRCVRGSRGSERGGRAQRRGSTLRPLRHAPRSSVAGLGGCPYAKGASGNVPTEDVVYMLHGMGIRTNTDLDKLVDAGQWMCDLLGRPNASKVAVARLAARAAAAAAAAGADAGDATAVAAAAKAQPTARLALCWPLGQTPEELLPPPPPP